MGLANRLRAWALARSPWILHFNASACNACDIEVLAALTPRYDAERFGVLLKGSPRHADILVVTGSVSRQVAPRLRRIYQQMPYPKLVMAVGTCATSGGVFKDGYNTYMGVDKVIPVDVYVTGCPAKPENSLRGVYLLIQKLKQIRELGPQPRKPVKVGEE